MAIRLPLKLKRTEEHVKELLSRGFSELRPVRFAGTYAINCSPYTSFTVPSPDDSRFFFKVHNDIFAEMHFIDTNTPARSAFQFFFVNESVRLLQKLTKRFLKYIKARDAWIKANRDSERRLTNTLKRRPENHEILRNIKAGAEGRRCYAAQQKTERQKNSTKKDFSSLIDAVRKTPFGYPLYVLGLGDTKKQKKAYQEFIDALNQVDGAITINIPRGMKGRSILTDDEFMGIVTLGKSLYSRLKTLRNKDAEVARFETEYSFKKGSLGVVPLPNDKPLKEWCFETIAKARGTPMNGPAIRKRLSRHRRKK